LRWLYGHVEDIALDPPYSLVTAGESLHWMEWTIVLPRLHKVLLHRVVSFAKWLLSGAHGTCASRSL